MKITDIRILLRDDDKLRAFVSVTFDNAFAVRGMKIIEGSKGTFLSATFAYLLFMGPAEVLLPYFVKNDFKGGAALLGTVFAMGGLGAILAAVVVAQLGFPRRQMTFIYLTWTVATLASAGYGLATFPWELMLACFVFNGFEAA